MRAKEREGDSRQVGPAAGAADDDVRIVTGHLKLCHRLLADHRLVQQHMVQHRAERVFGVLVLRGDLHRLADRDAEAARAIRVIRQDRAAGIGLGAGAGNAGRAPGLHQRLAVRLLVEAGLHHEDAHLQPEQRAGEGQRGAPLAGAGFGREPFHAGFLVVEGLRNGSVRLVAAGRADAFILVVDPGRGAERTLQPPCAEQRGGAPLPVDLAHRTGDFDFAFG